MGSGSVRFGFRECSDLLEQPILQHSGRREPQHEMRSGAQLPKPDQTNLANKRPVPETAFTFVQVSIRFLYYMFFTEGSDKGCKAVSLRSRKVLIVL